MVVTTPFPAALLQAWERGVERTVSARALLLLVAACPDTPPSALARLSIGQRDGLLLSLRESLFGPRLMCVADCPQCAEHLDVSIAVADVRAEPSSLLTGRESLALQTGEYDITFRLPTSEDMLAIDSLQQHLALALLSRCVERVVCESGESDIGSLPSDIVIEIGARMAAADPQADIRLGMTCPSCRHTWSAHFDIAAFLWVEVDDWAKRMLRDIHALASAYGWREGDILNMSTVRRQMYLDLIRG